MCRRPCGGGLCDYSVSPSPFGLDFGTQDFGTSDLGLTILVQYKGEGKCTRIQALGENAKKYRNDIKKLAMQIGWIVKKDYDDEMEIIRKQNYT